MQMEWKHNPQRQACARTISWWYPKLLASFINSKSSREYRMQSQIDSKSYDLWAILQVRVAWPETQNWGPATKAFPLDKQQT